MSIADKISIGVSLFMISLPIIFTVAILLYNFSDLPYFKKKREKYYKDHPDREPIFK